MYTGCEKTNNSYVSDMTLWWRGGGEQKRT